MMSSRRAASSLGLVPAVLVAAFTVTGCDWMSSPSTPPPAGPPPEITEPPRSLTTAETEVIRQSAAFGFGLLREILTEEPNSTHVISPFSASMALGMTMNGATGETFDEMRRTLGFEGMEEEEINRSYRDLVELLVSVDPAVSFSVANSVWYRHAYVLQNPFRAAVEGYFDARVEGIDLQNPNAPDIIDAWVRDATRNRIEDIAPRPIADNVVMYLINALHFLGDWRQAFDPADTRLQPFHNLDGTTTQVRMMSRSEENIVAYLSDGHVAADLRYGGGAWTMTAILPRPDASLSDLVTDLENGGWEELTSRFAPGTGIAPSSGGLIGLPRFTLAWKGSLIDPLERMGMEALFDVHRADLSRLFATGTGPLWVSEVLQKTWMRVDEQGTEAAAVTSVEVREVSAPPSVVFDRPFLLAIRERFSGTILFLGAIVEAPTD